MKLTQIWLLLLSFLLVGVCAGCATKGELPEEPEIIESSLETQLTPEDAYSKEQLERMKKTLELSDDGTLLHLEVSTQMSDFLALSALELDLSNKAIDEINQNVRFGYFIILPDFSNVAGPILLAAKGYWWCVAKVLKCELYTAGCLAAAPSCVAACSTVCTGTLGLGCVACVVACAAGGVAICDSAYDCWVEASAARCIP